MTPTMCAFLDDGEACFNNAEFRLATRVVERPACAAHLAPMIDALLFEEGARLQVVRLLPFEGTWDAGLSDPTIPAVLSARRLTERERARGR